MAENPAAGPNTPCFAFRADDFACGETRSWVYFPDTAGL